MSDNRVYCLVDPTTGHVRYVGATTRPALRHHEHLSSQGDTVTEDTPLGDWVRSLRRRGLRPRLVWMERCPDQDSLDLAEEFWTFYHREEEGADLLNRLPGGRVATRACFVAQVEGWVLHDGVRWRVDNVVKKEKTIERLGAEEVGTVVGFDRLPDGAPIFTRDGSSWLNVYEPPTVVPRAGDHPSIDRLIGFLVDGDPKAARYLVHWIARKVQEPGRKAMTAVVLQGQQGTGKDTLALIVMEMLGRQNCARIGQHDLEMAFNAHFVGGLLVVADEVVNNDNIRDTSAALKQYVTDETVQSHAKFVTPLEVPNRMGWIFTSNSQVPVRVEGDADRRYSVFQQFSVPPDDHRDMLAGMYGRDGLDRAFVEIEVAAFMHTLTSLAVDHEMLRRPFDNEARRMVALAGQTSVESFVTGLREDGLVETVSRLSPEAAKRDHDWLKVGRCETRVLFAVYREHCRESGQSPFGQSKFVVEMKRLLPSAVRTRLGRGYVRTWAYEGLPLAPDEPVEAFSGIGISHPTSREAIIAWGRAWIEKNPDRALRVLAAVEVEFGKENLPGKKLGRLKLHDFGIGAAPTVTPAQMTERIKKAAARSDRLDAQAETRNVEKEKDLEELLARMTEDPAD